MRWQSSPSHNRSKFFIFKCSTFFHFIVTFKWITCKFTTVLLCDDVDPYFAIYCLIDLLKVFEGFVWILNIDVTFKPTLFLFTTFRSVKLIRTSNVKNMFVSLLVLLTWVFNSAHKYLFKTFCIHRCRFKFRIIQKRELKFYHFNSALLTLFKDPITVVINLVNCYWMTFITHPSWWLEHEIYSGNSKHINVHCNEDEKNIFCVLSENSLHDDKCCK